MSTNQVTIVNTRKAPSLVDLSKSVGGTLKLDDLKGVEDYAFWSLKMRNYLESQMLWPYVSGQIKKPEIIITSNSESVSGIINTDDDADASAHSGNTPNNTVTGNGVSASSEMLSDWVARDDYARTAIMNKLGINPSNYVRYTWSSKEIWDALEKLYSTASKKTSRAIEQRVKHFMIDPDEDFDTQLAELTGLYKDLENLGRVIDDAEISRAILLALDDEVWGGWLESFDASHEDEVPGSHELTVILRTQWSKKVARQKKTKNATFVAKQKKNDKGTGSKAGVKCFKCGKKGHFANECRSKKKSSKDRASESDAKDKANTDKSNNDDKSNNSQPKQKTYANLSWVNPNAAAGTSDSNQNRVY